MFRALLDAAGGFRRGVGERMITCMSDTNTDDQQRPVAPGIARAMRDVRHADALTPPAQRRRWNRPSDRDASSETGED